MLSPRLSFWAAKKVWVDGWVDGQTNFIRYLGLLLWKAWGKHQRLVFLRYPGNTNNTLIRHGLCTRLFLPSPTLRKKSCLVRSCLLKFQVKLCSANTKSGEEWRRMWHMKKYHSSVPEVAMACTLLLQALKRSPPLEQETGQGFHRHSQLGHLDSALPSHPVQCFLLLPTFVIDQSGVTPQKNKPIHEQFVLEENSSRDTKFMRITSVCLSLEVFVSQVVSGWETTRRSITCLLCSFALPFWSSYTIGGRILGWPSHPLHLTHYSCSHVCKLWDFKQFKNPERNGLLPKSHVGSVLIFKKNCKIQDVHKK